MRGLYLASAALLSSLLFHSSALVMILLSRVSSKGKFWHNLSNLNNILNTRTPVLAWTFSFERWISDLYTRQRSSTSSVESRLLRVSTFWPVCFSDVLRNSMKNAGWARESNPELPNSKVDIGFICPTRGQILFTGLKWQYWHNLSSTSCGYPVILTNTPSRSPTAGISCPRPIKTLQAKLKWALINARPTAREVKRAL